MVEISHDNHCKMELFLIIFRTWIIRIHIFSLTKVSCPLLSHQHTSFGMIHLKILHWAGIYIPLFLTNLVLKFQKVQSCDKISLVAQIQFWSSMSQKQQRILRKCKVESFLDFHLAYICLPEGKISGNEAYQGLQEIKKRRLGTIVHETVVLTESKIGTTAKIVRIYQKWLG